MIRNPLIHDLAGATGETEEFHADEICLGIAWRRQASGMADADFRLSLFLADRDHDTVHGVQRERHRRFQQRSTSPDVLDVECRDGFEPAPQLPDDVESRTDSTVSKWNMVHVDSQPTRIVRLGRPQKRRCLGASALDERVERFPPGRKRRLSQQD